MNKEVELLGYWRTLVRNKKIIFLVVSIATTVSLIVSLILPKTYRAEATLMPLGNQRSMGFGAAAVAQLGLVGSLLSGNINSSPSAPLLAVLKSKTLTERVVEKHDLLKVFFSQQWDSEKQKWKKDDVKKAPQIEDALAYLSKKVFFIDDKKNQLILIKAELFDPKLTADLVNSYIKELANFINENTFTSAKSNRIFIEKQLERNKIELLESGKELTSFYESNKISNVIPTMSVSVTVGAGDVEQQSSDTGPKNIEELSEQSEELKKKIEQAKIVKDIPQQVYLQYLTLRRVTLGQMNALLEQQYEMAKIDEAKEDLNFQVIDWARVPRKKYKPQRRQIVFGSFLMSLFLASFYVFLKEHLEKEKTGGRQLP